jgi:transposase
MGRAEMIENWDKKRIWVYREGIDFRKQVNGLVQIIIDESKSTPELNGIYLFRNHKRDKIKLLTWDRNGFFMGYKRLERGKYDFPRDKDVVEMTTEELRDLMSGMPMVSLKTQNREFKIMS